MAQFTGNGHGRIWPTMEREPVVKCSVTIRCLHLLSLLLLLWFLIILF